VKSELKVNSRTLKMLLKIMMIIRTFEEKVQVLFYNSEIPGLVHLYLGQEAIAAGVCLALEPKDRITSTHRGHGHIIAKDGKTYTASALLLKGLTAGLMFHSVLSTITSAIVKKNVIHSLEKN